MSDKHVKKLEDALDDIGCGKFQIILSAIICLTVASDAVEIMTLSFLGPLLHCHWNISTIDQSLLTSLLFVGMFIGGASIGHFSDQYGRKPMMIICAVLLIVTGLLAAASPTLIWMFLYRVLIGISIAGILVSLTTLSSEIMPTNSRANGIFFAFFSFPLGSAFVTLLYLGTIEKLGWRLFLVISNVPIILIVPMLLWIPESPRFLLLSGRKSEAIAVINRIARINGKDEIEGLEKVENQPHSIADLWHPNYRVTSLVLFMLWLIAGLTYYGNIILITVLNSIPRKCLQNTSQIYVGIARLKGIDDSCCKKVGLDGTIDTLISIAGEMIISPILILLVNKLGRKFTMNILFVIVAAIFFVLNFCMPIWLYRFVILFIRGVSNIIFISIVIYTPEVFPTSVRSIGFGICSGFARIGAIIAPFIINVLIIHTNFLVGTMVFVITNLLGFLLVFLLPYETKGRQLCQTAEDDPRVYNTDTGYIELKTE